MKVLKLIGLHIISLPVFSRIWGKIARIRRPVFLVRKIIRYFRARYRIDMKEYVGDIEDYPSLADFFVRRLDPGKRPLEPHPAMIVSPADGFLQSCETIFKDEATQVKGVYYSISELVMESLDLSTGWHILTVYLSPANYHRFHYPFSGKLTGYCHTRGPLFPVNKTGLHGIKGLFVRNERVVSRFEIGGRTAYTVAVGATNVGSIRMEYINQIQRDNQWRQTDIEVNQLEEMGRFEMGSTLVIVCPKDVGIPLKETEGKPVRVGDPLIAKQ